MAEKKHIADKLIESYEADFELSKEESWEKLMKSVQNKEKERRLIPHRTLYYAAGIAAVIFISSLFLINKTTQVKTQNSETLTYMLPDNSTVELNANSTLSYKTFLWRYRRRLNLDGEAFFKVEEGRKFTVESKIASIVVLGTEFNVFARDDNFETKCYSGRVMVKRGERSEILSRGMQVSVNSENNLLSNDFNAELKKDWRNGIFNFENKSLEFVLSELERQYNVDVDIKNNLKNRTYTGYFSNTELQGALDNICIPLNLTYSINNNKILILEKE